MSEPLKNYKVRLEGSAVAVVLQAESVAKAVEYAMDALSYGDMDITDQHVEEIPDAQLDSAKRHADAVAEPDDETPLDG